MEDLNQVLRVRREKLDALREAGVEPFVHSFEPGDRTVDVIVAFEGLEASEGLTDDGDGHRASIAGRIISWRDHGKSQFLHLEDGAGALQVYVKKNVIGDEAFEGLSLLDLGDWVGVEGAVFRTRTGEVTVRAESYTLLTKALRPLPFGKVETDPDTGERVEHSGFADQETRYRQRYADLAVHPDVREIFRTRSRIITALRSFLDGEGFLEVETPVLQPLYGGASAEPFETHYRALGQTMYLRIADELYLKRLIVGGLDRVYEISKDFRNEGLSPVHNPEFTMLEWYQAFTDYNAQMALVERMLQHVMDEVFGTRQVISGGNELVFEAPFRRMSLVGALSEALGSDVHEMDAAELLAKAKELEVPELDGAGRGKLIDKLFGVLVEPDLVQPTFVIDHPKELSPLAKVHRSDARVTERFELYLNGTEMLNGFSELNDPIDQRARFEAQAALREAGDAEAQPIDDDYVRALEYGMPPTGGVGLGIDRFVMMVTNQSSIRDVILFPILRSEE